VLQAFAAAFRTPDLRRKLLFSLAMIAIYRLGASVPGPGVSVQAINSCLEQAQASSQRDIYSLVNLFSAVRCSGSRSSPSASCRTSLPASSCSCWWS